MQAAVGGLASELADLRRRVAAAAEAAAAAAADAAEAAAALAGPEPGMGPQSLQCGVADGTALVPVRRTAGPYQGCEPDGVAAELAALRAAAAAGARREAALLAVTAALTGALAAGLLKGQARRPRVRAAVVALAAANGLLGLLLHFGAWLPGVWTSVRLGAGFSGGSDGGVRCAAGAHLGAGLPQCFVAA